MAQEAHVQAIYRRRFTPDLAFRDEMWRILTAEFFQQFIPPDSTVLEVGAGYCEFINHIQAARKIAVDMNEDTFHYARDAEVIITSSTDLSAIPSKSVDIVFVSNFFEHLERPDITATMREIARVLRPGGRCLILQPNIKYCGGDYWMFFDHVTPLDHRSLAEALEISGFRVTKTIVRFLPYTTKSRIPQFPALVRAYLRFPLIWRVLGKQTFMIAEVDR